MKEYTIAYNPDKDIQQVEQSGAVNLALANKMNSIPSQLQALELRFNGIEDPNSIGLRPSDEFEAMQAAKAITEAAASVKTTSDAQPTE